MNKQMIAPCPVHIVFDGPPGHESGRFVECETPDGKSVNIGEWHERADGLWELRITCATPAEPRLADGEMTEKVAKALCKSHKLNPDAKIACLNPEHHHKPQWVAFKAHAQAAIAAYNPDVRLRKALERTRRGIAALEVGAMPFRDDYIARIDEALSPLSQGED